jgi:hypothetical protein
MADAEKKESQRLSEMKPDKITTVTDPETGEVHKVKVIYGDKDARVVIANIIRNHYLY